MITGERCDECSVSWSFVFRGFIVSQDLHFSLKRDISLGCARSTAGIHVPAVYDGHRSIDRNLWPNGRIARVMCRYLHVLSGPLEDRKHRQVKQPFSSLIWTDLVCISRFRRRVLLRRWSVRHYRRLSSLWDLLSKSIGQGWSTILFSAKMPFSPCRLWSLSLPNGDEHLLLACEQQTNQPFLARIPREGWSNVWWH